jgi:hypothetical protein
LIGEHPGVEAGTHLGGCGFGGGGGSPKATATTDTLSNVPRKRAMSFDFIV